MQRRTPFAVLVPLLLITLALPAAAEQQDGWREVRSAEGRFVVMMPAEPTVETKTTDTDLGPIEMHVYGAAGPTLYTGLMYYDIPGGVTPDRDVAELLEKTCDGFMKGAGLVEKAERKVITIDGHPGRELYGEAKDGSAAMIARYYVVDDRIYLVLVGVEVGQTASPVVEKYFGSFRLLD